MRFNILYVLLSVVLTSTPLSINAQSKAWAAYSNGVLTFSYGSKPVAPSQVTCSGCGKQMPKTANYCSSCGTKLDNSFVVYEVLAIKTEWDYYERPWSNIVEAIKKVIFNPSFKQYYPTNLASFFMHMKNLEQIVGIEYLNTSKAISMDNMFDGCEHLKSIDLSHFNTTNVTDMSGMFSGCRLVNSLNLSTFDTKKVTNMSHMFECLDNLESLNISSFNTSSVTTMLCMFRYCPQLKALDVSHFDTRNVKEFGSMFESCKRITSLNVSNFNTSKGTYFNGMFQWCKNLTTLDVSSFDTTNATNMLCMFYECTQLRTLYVSATKWKTDIRRPSDPRDNYGPFYSYGSTKYDFYANIIKK